MKKIVILGKDSYIGEALYSWLSKDTEKFSVDIISTLNYKWKDFDFSEYDIAINLAGIAHINKMTDDMKELFFSINRDLTIEIGSYLKEHGIKYMLHFSSMNVYGDYCECVTSRLDVCPTSFYGESKLQGDIGLKQLEDENFKVGYIRPPFVYGKGCKGNYNIISKIAKKLPVFPDYVNKKSMIYIDNLCEFVRLLVENEDTGYFTPQNRELVSTTELVRVIAKCNGRNIWFTRLFNWGIPIGKKIVSKVRKAFSNDCYSLELSDYYNFEYCVVTFEESVRRTER